MKTQLNNIKKFGLLAITVPLLTGCGGGGAAALGLGSLFGFAGGGSPTIGIAGPGPGPGLAAIVNPEPASLLLMGGGMAAMAFYKSRKKS